MIPIDVSALKAVCVLESVVVLLKRGKGAAKVAFAENEKLTRGVAYGVIRGLASRPKPPLLCPKVAKFVGYE
jgi:hypothetical protein